ncbi:MAG: ABC-2 transporter permease [Woeseiaceae bacterium]|jgi:ABC-2 type transport system permease protein|nr:ABC-2 transporter permease [Woeseiaceae bacterium]
MIRTQIALIKREIWEHRSIWVTPAAIAVVTILMAATGLAIGEGFRYAADMAIVGASNVGEIERRALLTGALSGVTFLFVFAMWVLTVFYCLDSLYAERKDKSILFWRSLPITDTETVFSKLVVALLAIPAATLVGIVVTQLANLVVMSIWVSGKGGSPGHLLWDFGALFDIWGATLIFLVTVPLWLSPFVGWFLFVSAFAKRSPLLVAFLPIVVVPMLERMILGTSYLAKAIFVRSAKMPLFGDISPEKLFDEERMALAAENVSLLSMIDIGRFLLSPSLWTGLVVCGLFTTAAIYVRRYRDES